MDIKKNQYYVFSLRYTVSEKPYQILGEISNNSVLFQGAFIKSGHKSEVVTINIDDIDKLNATELADFVGMLPSEVRIAMHNIIARIITVYRFLNTNRL